MHTWQTTALLVEFKLYLSIGHGANNRWVEDEFFARYVNEQSSAKPPNRRSYQMIKIVRKTPNLLFSLTSLA